MAEKRSQSRLCVRLVDTGTQPAHLPRFFEVCAQCLTLAAVVLPETLALSDGFATHSHLFGQCDEKCLVVCFTFMKVNNVHSLGMFETFVNRIEILRPAHFEKNRGVAALRRFVTRLYGLCHGPLLLCVLAISCQNGQKARVNNAAAVLQTHAETEAQHRPPPKAQPRWFSDDVAYEIFVRSFQDSNADGIGDIPGLLQRLDHLNDGQPGTGDDLEVGLLWLMPLHPSPSYHGYDVLDYRAVHPEYGTLDDMKKLLDEANRRGIRIILDFVVNHTSNQHPWFLAAAANDSAYRDYYLWRDAPDPRWKRPWDGASVWHPNPHGDDYYLGLFWGGMPDLNLENPAVFEEIASAMEFWLDLGVAGFRLDAVRHLVEEVDGDEVRMTDTRGSHEWLKRLRRRLSQSHPDVLLVGEAWSSPQDIQKYAGDGDELHMAFSFGLAAGITNAVVEGQRVYLVESLEEHRTLLDNMPAFSAPFLTNHDMTRFAQRVGTSRDKLHLAAALLLMMPGTPFLYYGEEIGMQGAKGKDDPGKRTPMLWQHNAPLAGFSSGQKPWFPIPDDDNLAVSVQNKSSSSLLHTYRQIIRLRNQQPSLRRGRLRWQKPEGGGRGALVLIREGVDRDDAIALAINLHSESDSFLFPRPGAAATKRTASPQPILGTDENARDALKECDARWLWGKGLSESDIDWQSDRVTVSSIAGHGFAFLAFANENCGEH